jgi:hypothetical protein
VFAHREENPPAVPVLVRYLLYDPEHRNLLSEFKVRLSKPDVLLYFAAAVDHVALVLLEEVLCMK